MKTLNLNVKRIYFERVRDGEKSEEYRLVTPYWHKRLVGRQYDQIRYCLGYPRAGNSERTLIFPYRGFNIKIVTHEHFGEKPVQVFAIPLQ